MKKSLYIGAMAALLLGTASCSNDMEPVVADGSEVAANFTLNLGDAVDSRTISDGTKADQLWFFVYENGQEITALRQLNVTVTNKTAYVTTKLVKGHTYSFVFWAQKSGNTFWGINPAASTVTMRPGSSSNPIKCNDDNADAFYNVLKDFEVTGSFTEDVTLYRPFAQINILASDAASVTDFENYTSSINGWTGDIKFPESMNLLTGETTGNTMGSILENSLPTEPLPGYEQYKFVCTRYVLAPVEQTIVSNINFSLKYNNSVRGLTIPNIPIRRNYRTNIIGDFFTEGANYNIEINPMYIGNHDVDLDATVFNVTSDDELTTALNSDAKKIVINLMNDVQLRYGARTEYGHENTESITIDGNGHTLDMYGTNTDWSSISAAGDGTLIIKNAIVNYTSANTSTTWNGHDINIAKSKDSAGSGKFIAKNVRFNNAISFGVDAELENVTVEDEWQEKEGIYAIWIQATVSNVSLKNCNIIQRAGRAIKVDSQYKDDDQLVLTNITVDGCKFVSFKKAAIMIKNKMGANIVASNYDITEVNADNVNLVWNDSNNSAYYDLITVTGCTKKQEGQ